jgi:hypothetical protein
MSVEAITSSPSAPPPAVDEILVPPSPIIDEPNPGAGDKPEPVKADKAPAEKPLSARDALKAAAEKLEKQDADAKPDAKAEKARDETGKFAAKEGEKIADPKAAEAKPKVEPDKTAPHYEAPARFSTDAKAKWTEVDESVRAETHRAIKELEQGHAKYKEDATNYEQFREFHKLAKDTNTDPVTALRNYVGIDKLLSENLVAGLERICTNKGISLKEVAAHIMGQPADKVQSQSAAEIRQLKAELAEIKQSVGTVTGHLTEQQSRTAADEVAVFAKDKPLFDELSDKIVSHITNDGLSLQAAYDKAVSDAQALAQRLGFIPKTEAAPLVPDVDLVAQTQRGQKSIAGAPSAGSAPASQKPSSSIKDALRRAMQSASV